MRGTTSNSGPSASTRSIPWSRLFTAGGNFVLNISASPFWIGKREFRRDMLASIARQHKVPVALVNQVGGNDSLVFDGSSLVLNREGKVIAQGRSFEEDLIYFDSKALTGEMHEQIAGDEASAYSALVLGTRDYMHKCGFQKAIIGLSGGIDSALTAVDRRRCRRSRERDRCRHARTLLLAGFHRRRARAGKESRHPLRTALDQSRLRGLSPDVEGVFSRD